MRYGPYIPSIEFSAKPLTTRKNTGLATSAAGKSDMVDDAMSGDRLGASHAGLAVCSRLPRSPAPARDDAPLPFYKRRRSRRLGFDDAGLAGDLNGKPNRQKADTNRIVA
jgi:hypothetical protein